MPLKTRQNPQTGILEVFVDDDWVQFEEYRDRQIEEAYRNSIRFLRERLGEDAAPETKQRRDDPGPDR
jgi:hypothetical protein